MKAIVTTLRVTASTVLALLFFAALCLNLVLGFSRDQLLDADFYKHNLAENDAYERISGEVIPELAASPDYYGDLQISTQDAVTLLRRIFGEDFVQGQTEYVIENVVDWLKSEDEGLNLVIDLKPIKQHARSEVLAFVERYIDFLPTIESGQDPRLDVAGLGRLPIGIPRDMEREQVKAEFLAQAAPFIDRNLDKAPDELDLVAEAAERDNKTRDEFLDQFDDARRVIRRATGQGYMLSLLGMVVLLALLGAVHLPRARSSLRWGGITVLVAGLVLLTATIVVYSVVPDRIDSTAIVSSRDIPAGIVDLAVDVEQTLVSDSTKAFILPTAIVTGSGLVLFVASFFVFRRRPAEPEPVPIPGEEGEDQA